MKYNQNSWSISSELSLSQINLIVYLTAITSLSNCTTSQPVYPRRAYHLELSHGGSAEKGDLNISITIKGSPWKPAGHIDNVTVPNAGPCGQQLLLFEFNDCRGWNMGLHKKHVSVAEPRGIELCNIAVQRYGTCTYWSHLKTNLTLDRHGKPFRGTTPVSQSYSSSRNNCSNHILWNRPCRHSDSTVLRTKP